MFEDSKLKLNNKVSGHSIQRIVFVCIQTKTFPGGFFCLDWTYTCGDTLQQM